jgi:hypothetical protein
MPRGGLVDGGKTLESPAAGGAGALESGTEPLESGAGALLVESGFGGLSGVWPDAFEPAVPDPAVPDPDVPDPAVLGFAGVLLVG